MSVLALTKIQLAARASAAGVIAGQRFAGGIFTARRTKATAACQQLSDVERLGIDELGINFSGPVFRNLSYDELAQHEEANKEGVFTANGTFAVDTGKFTGRSPQVR